MLSELLEKVSLFRILHRIDTDLCKKNRCQILISDYRLTYMCEFC